MRQRGRLVLPALLLVGLAILFTNVFPFRRMLAQDRQIDLARAQLELLRSENERLEAEAIALQTPQEIERIARENFGYVRPGEVAYVVVEPDPVPAADASTAGENATVGSTVDGVSGADTAADERPWWQALWDWLTGRDLLEGQAGAGR